ncbi:M56 family metallopeptidase [Flavobacterium okayamense]|uniref:TonB C-terminal domain-containing protein n=1 Tax=Flavobacterium okayamense TaxID=2830782 RepID=A0ABN6HZ87_9FLAO|nr:M56 family metallopeptidase [Flavobacterium okayamense]BCY28106.1 hypothetical protein KK2020170_09740 [Flavobacterium okayamense]
MIDFLLYTLKTIGIQLLFLIAYQILLSKETFFNANRFYLIGSFIASLIIPLINIKSIDSNSTIENVFNLKEILLVNGEKTSEIQLASNNSINLLKTVETIYIIGFVLFITLLIYKLKKIKERIDNSQIEFHENIKIYRIQNSNEAFSFLNLIFIGQNNTEITTVLQHELTHKNKWHSVDLFLLEIAKTIFWFNPLLWHYQKKLAEVHEYEADAIAVKKNAATYYKSIINQVFQVENFAFTNNFFNESLIKKRIVMLQKSKSKKAMLLKYGIVIPAILISVSLFSNKIYAQTETNEKTTSKEKNEISFSEVDEVPRFLQCENVSKEDAMKCFNEKMMEHITKNFNYPKEAAKKNIQGQVSIQFIIDKEGNIKDIVTHGPVNGELLEKEARRIISLLPKLIPAKHKGKTVNIKYGLPLTFKLQDK